MAIILDTNGNELEYIPIHGMKEGDTVGPFIIKIQTPDDSILMATKDDRVLVEGRVNGVGLFQDLATDPIDLSTMPAAMSEFEIKVTAITPWPGNSPFERVPIRLLSASLGTADWFA